MKRDYDAEIKDNEGRKYSYNFDFDIIHNFMLRSFEPFFEKGKALELGCFKGEFTKKLMRYNFSSIYAIEASKEACDECKKLFGDKVTIFNSTFEEATLDMKFENIFLTHVLEHIDDPINLLNKIKTEWLDVGGKLFIACPNANAASRQIAVYMGLIESNNSVTEAEKKHGHKRTYSFDTLEHDIRKAGLNIIYRGGVFFKALANFQWDRLMQTDIISKEYLEGCYLLGQKYPDLCSSIIFICEKK